MKLIKEFSEFTPQNDLVNNYLKIIEDKYQVISDSNTKYKLVLIDDKIYYLNGPYGFKSRLVNRIYYDLNFDGNLHEPSLRKAIKEWLDKNSI